MASPAIAGHRHHSVAWPQGEGCPARRGDVQRSRRPHEEPLLLQQPVRSVQYLLVPHLDGVVDQGQLEVGRDAVQPHSLHDGVVAVATKRFLRLLVGVAHSVLYFVEQTGALQAVQMHTYIDLEKCRELPTMRYAI